MSCGFLSYSFNGESYYIIATGDEKLSRLSIRCDSPPTKETDTLMMSMAEMAKKWICEGSCSEADIELDASPFQRKVLETTCRIPKGFVSTYYDVGKTIGCSGYRAVGNALHKNPISLFIPCHRVVKKDGSIGGYETGSDLKRHILLKEGIKFDEGKVIAEQIIGWRELKDRSALCPF